jgi:RPA family protein
MEIKRLTAKKSSVKEIVNGRFVRREGFESSYVLTNLGRRLSRVRVVGLIVDKFITPDEKYATITLDDASDTIRCKAFVNIKIFDGFGRGDMVEVFGKVREYNEEIYIMSEIIRDVDPNFEILRMLELEKNVKKQKEKIKKVIEIQKQTSDLDEMKVLIEEKIPFEEVEGIIEAQINLEESAEEESITSNEIKNRILKLIEEIDRGEGADYQEILKKSKFSENEVDFAVQDLLETGVCYEPKPGLIKKL